MINVYNTLVDGVHSGPHGNHRARPHDLSAVTCTADDSLAEAARAMQTADTGSVVVTDDGKVAGILTERDLLRAAAAGGDPDAKRSGSG